MKQITTIIQEGLRLHQAGDLSAAEAAYQTALEADAECFDALHLLGVIASQRGEHARAVALIKRAVQSNPHQAFARNNLGLAHEGQGEWGLAEACYRAAIGLQPNFGDAYFNLGNVLHRQHRFDAAVESYQRAITLNGADAQSHYNLAQVRRAQGKWRLAEEAYRAAIRWLPIYAEAHHGLGEALFAQHRWNEAVASFRMAIEQRANYSDAHNDLGRALHKLEKFAEAEQQYRLALKIEPDCAEVHSNLAETLRLGGESDAAWRHFQRALSIKPELLSVHLGLVDWYLDRGEFGGAQAALAQALALEPDNQAAWALQTRMRKMTLADADWLQRALQLAQAEGELSAGRIALQFAIGKYYDDTQQYNAAFAAFARGNALQRQIAPAFDRAAMARLVDSVLATYKADFVCQPASARAAELPVFIVGMPRSGTSLLEQIIASHPHAAGAGELTFWAEQFEVHGAGSLGAHAVASVADEYVQRLRRHSADALRITDKMPSNFLWLSLIHRIFPKAKIIHIRRNPLDTCLSIYCQNFLAGHAYSTSLEDLDFYYRQYLRLMSHWREVLPAECLLELRYEDLTEQSEAWSRKIIDFIGLEWSDACLEFYNTERKVGTASNWQVRQKIYHSSRARWRNYEQHLQPLLGLLEADS